jgi:hypothetical protein
LSIVPDGYKNPPSLLFEDRNIDVMAADIYKNPPSLLFEDRNIDIMAADIDTNLLYFCDKEIFVANEQGEIINKFSCMYPLVKIFASCGIILTCKYESPYFRDSNKEFRLYTADGKQITQVIDSRISSDICFVHDKGMVVSARDIVKDLSDVIHVEINLWRVV